MSNNLADLILSNRSSLASLITAYDLETAGTEMEYQRRIREAEAFRRTNTEAARAHFEEGLRRAGITLFDLQRGEDDSPLSGMVTHPHLPEPITDLGTFRRWDEVTIGEVGNGVGEARPEEATDTGEATPSQPDLVPGENRDDPGTDEPPAVRLGEVPDAGGNPVRSEPEPAAVTPGTCSVCGQATKRRTCHRCCANMARTVLAEKQGKQPQHAAETARESVCPDCGVPTPTGGCCNRCRAKRASRASLAKKAERGQAAAALAPENVAVQPVREETPAIVAPEPAPVEILPCKADAIEPVVSDGEKAMLATLRGKVVVSPASKPLPKTPHPEKLDTARLMQARAQGFRNADCIRQGEFFVIWVWEDKYGWDAEVSPLDCGDPVIEHCVLRTVNGKTEWYADGMAEPIGRPQVNVQGIAAHMDYSAAELSGRIGGAK